MSGFTSVVENWRFVRYRRKLPSRPLRLLPLRPALFSFSLALPPLIEISRVYFCITRCVGDFRRFARWPVAASKSRKSSVNAAQLTIRHRNSLKSAGLCPFRERRLSENWKRIEIVVRRTVYFKDPRAHTHVYVVSVVKYIEAITDIS